MATSCGSSSDRERECAQRRESALANTHTHTHTRANHQMQMQPLFVVASSRHGTARHVTTRVCVCVLGLTQHALSFVVAVALPATVARGGATRPSHTHAHAEPANCAHIDKHAYSDSDSDSECEAAALSRVNCQGCSSGWLLRPGQGCRSSGKATHKSLENPCKNYAKPAESIRKITEDGGMQEKEKERDRAGEERARCTYTVRTERGLSVLPLSICLELMHSYLM